MNGNLVTLAAGVFIAVMSWVPLLIVEAHDRYAMPVGLGVLAFAGCFVGCVIALVAGIRLAITRFKGVKP